MNVSKVFCIREHSLLFCNLTSSKKTANFKSYIFQREKAFQIWLQIILKDERWLQRLEKSALLQMFEYKSVISERMVNFVTLFFSFPEIKSILLISSFVRHSGSMRLWHYWIWYRHSIPVLLYVRLVCVFSITLLKINFTHYVKIRYLNGICTILKRTEIRIPWRMWGNQLKVILHTCSLE